MSKVKALYDQHIEDLRKIAIEKNVHLADLLMIIVKSTPLATPQEIAAFNSRGHRTEEVEKILMERWRMAVYEQIANRALETEEQVKKAERSLKKQEAALKVGRDKGLKIRQEQARTNLEQIRQINSDLLNLPAKDGWTVEARAVYIAEKVGLSITYVRKQIATKRRKISQA